MIISSNTVRPAPPETMRRDVADVIRRRAEADTPPASLVIRDSSAITIACFFRSDSQSGRVFEQLLRTGSVDCEELVAAAEFERGFAADIPDMGALSCVITWAKAKAAQRRDRRPAQS